MTESERIQSIKNNGGRHLQDFKEQNITYAMCLVAVELDGTAFYMVPKQFRNEEIYKLACKTHGSILHAVPPDFISKGICECAVSSDGLAIEYVPEEFKTREMFLLAAKNNPLVMQKMPIEYLDADFCIAVVEKYGNSAISSLPKTHKNGKFYVLLVEKKPDLLWHIPKNGHAAAVCKTAIKAMGYSTTADAVKDNPELLSQLHTSLYDHDTCLAFAQSKFLKDETSKNTHGFNTDSDYVHGLVYLRDRYEEHYSLKHILRWPDVCEIVIEQLPSCIRYVKEDVLTYEMCLTAIKKCGRFFSDVPMKFRSKELCLIAFEYDPHNIEEFPEEHLSYDLYLQAVSRSGYILKNTPKQYLTRELCFAAVSNVGHQIKNVPIEFLDEELCLAALYNLNGLGYGILGDIPEEHRTYQVCLAAVQVDSGSFKYVPEKHKTYALCLEAAEKTTSAKNLPEEFYTEE